MSQVACENCRRDVEASAEECPHCKWAQPERFFQAGLECKVCPYCRVKNYIALEQCRSCGTILHRPSTPWQCWREWNVMRAKLQICGFLGAVLGATFWLVYLIFIRGTFDDPTMSDPLAKVFVFGFNAFLGGGVGWIAGMLVGALSLLFRKSEAAR